MVAILWYIACEMPFNGKKTFYIERTTGHAFIRSCQMCWVTLFWWVQSGWLAHAILWSSGLRMQSCKNMIQADGIQLIFGLQFESPLSSWSPDCRMTHRDEWTRSLFRREAADLVLHCYRLQSSSQCKPWNLYERPVRRRPLTNLACCDRWLPLE